ncbi:MAG: hypothetical protein VYA34_06860 [Myxococcota bacterium]|nr:hypothetical protein [Myxococcota bacterium]
MNELKKHPVVAGILIILVFLGWFLAFSYGPDEWSYFRKFFAGFFGGLGSGLLIVATRLFNAMGDESFGEDDRFK